MLKITLAIIYLIGFIVAVPLQPKEDDFTFLPKTDKPDSVEALENSRETDNLTGSNNSSDLFVVKTIVYEIGILTDAENDTNFDNKTHEQIDVSFFDPKSNDTFIDLSNIPVPYQTNVNGVSVTGFIPANFGNLAKNKNGTVTVEGSNFPLLPDKQVKVIHNVSTSNKNESEYVLSGLSDILGLPDWLGKSKEKNEDASLENKSDTSES
ncbi:uncharacterized protein LOC130898459 [Diorhabda carinulata]|uniref:uncharacterized protein LOC130898459 n=1 Tax=Diorhabda carinulata TaxID=1163345 RepID=UPI0025A08A61|nr:uncharacterized protein LOC130898459 [Diorhabda carinulata]